MTRSLPVLLARQHAAVDGEQLTADPRALVLRQGAGRVRRRPVARADRQRPRPGQDRGRREPAEAQREGHPLPRSLLFIAFTAEEEGLIGSGYFVNHPPLPLGKAVAMLNLDMVGRVRSHTLYVGGSGTAASALIRGWSVPVPRGAGR